MTARVDDDVAKLVRRHRARMTCGAGCAACCTRISVLPVEWYIVRTKFAGRATSSASPTAPRGTIVTSPPANPCGFLRNGRCSIYHDRPLVCRVHGLPLRYRVVSYDQTGAALENADSFATVWCDLNFTGHDPARPTFAERECFDMNRLNSELDALNAAFLRTAAGRRFVGCSGVFLCDDSA